jgi:hypothetical protein
MNESITVYYQTYNGCVIEVAVQSGKYRVKLGNFLFEDCYETLTAAVEAAREALDANEDFYAIVDMRAYQLVDVLPRPEAFALLLELGRSNDKISAILVEDGPACVPRILGVIEALKAHRSKAFAA